ncbi:Fe-S cluster assembly protein SufD [Bremerella cremea]|uniref:Fe-S cluster assembly protein SufD n=1 Tax=Bremerella cremea TaxID=1031537 RepID=UPI0031EE994E
MSVGTAASIENWDAEAFNQYVKQLGEPEWLVNLRQEAFETFEGMDWPTRKEEEWMRTDIRGFQLKKFNPPNLNAPIDPASLSRGLLADGVDIGGQVVSLNGKTAVSSISEELKAQGVIFGDFESVLAEHGDLVQKYLFQGEFDPNFDKFSALHAAFFSNGMFLYVPRNVTVEQPLHFLSLLGDNGVDLAHTLIVLEEGAQATVLTESASLDDEKPGMHCGAIEVIVGDRANLRFVNLQNWGEKVWHFAQQKGCVGRDANLFWTLGALGSRLSKVNQHVALDKPGAHCEVNGVLFTEGKQHLSYHTQQYHRAPSCTSNFLYKAALQDQSRTVWRGMIKVAPGAQKTDGYQRIDNLLLTEHSRADSIPGLEIEADDVRCTHGATTGRVDEEQVFYAMARGFTRKEATRMIVTGFFQQVFDRITLETVREALGHAIATRVREYE